MDIKKRNDEVMDLLLSVHNVSFGSVDELDSPDFSNAYVSDAIIMVKGGGLRDATQEELQVLNDNMDWFFDDLFEYV